MITSSDTALICAVLLVILIILLQPTLVDTAKTLPPNKVDNHHCNHRGQINVDTSICDCYGDWHGPQCTLSKQKFYIENAVLVDLYYNQNTVHLEYHGWNFQQQTMNEQS